MSCRGGDEAPVRARGVAVPPRSLMPPVARSCGFAGEKPAAVRLQKLTWRLVLYTTLRKNGAMKHRNHYHYGRRCVRHNPFNTGR